MKVLYSYMAIAINMTVVLNGIRKEMHARAAETKWMALYTGTPIRVDQFILDLCSLSMLQNIIFHYRYVRPKQIPPT